MLNKLKIENFKCIDSQEFELKALTILTGINSSGKSSVLQAILLLSSYYSKSNKSKADFLASHFSVFNEIRNKYKNARSLNISAQSEFHNFHLSQSEQSDDSILINVLTSDSNQLELDCDNNLYYLSANRTGQENFSNFDKNQKIGMTGEYIFGYFHDKKDELIENSLINFEKK